VVGQGNKAARFFIWLQELIKNRSIKYAGYGHVIIMTHRDETGRPWGIEASTHGIGWTNLEKRHGTYGLTNVDQPKTNEQRQKIIDLLTQLLGSKYDYTAYLRFVLTSLGMSPEWTWLDEYTDTDIPPSFICSAVADFEYEVNHLPNPGGDKVTRYTTPADWARWIDTRGWEQ
jgi:hypothetical protein